MTEVLQSSPSHHFPSPSSSSSSPCVNNDISHQLSIQEIGLDQDQQLQVLQQHHQLEEEEEEEEEDFLVERKDREREGDQLSILELLITVFRRSVVGCSITTTATGGGSTKGICKMEIGLPTNVRHVAHVTFDRFNGFLGLPVEFEPEVPRRAPSASATVFGVSTESMQLSYDSRGNSVPTILLMMQRQLYARGGLQAEGIFRINAENGQEEYVREQLNRGVIPEDIDVHCLAGLIKAWFRELPTGVLDSLSQEQVMQSQSEEECVQLTRLLPPTEAALLDWALNLMADVAQMEHLNKMNARNVAMVFAPNMTQMSDPLTALMYAVQVMNFLKTLIVRILREREESVIDPAPNSRLEPFDENGHQSSCHQLFTVLNEASKEENREEEAFVSEEPSIETPPRLSQDDFTTEKRSQNFLTSIENLSTGGNWSLVDNCPCEVVSQVGAFTKASRGRSCRSRTGQSSNSNFRSGSKMANEHARAQAAGSVEKSKGASLVGSMNPRTDLFEAWR
ncbi:rho GTPase-activating protein 4-like [Mercurialis annua]|uniref:rho GTPase-activating protein 4-like n=1 Tax=Mercurialis annua TaxID=3986 RepID=UPI00215EB62F|nr:rho GTPase-activating protein 4-like [Mercurialis annua]